MQIIQSKINEIHTGNLMLGFIMGFALSIASCENEINLELPEYTSNLVVEGWIEQGKSAQVLLTYSAAFFTTIDSSNIREYAATRAKVTLVHGSEQEILTLKPNSSYFPPLFYFGTKIFGEVDANYTLIIEDNDEIYQSETYIPKIVYPDSVWFETEPGYDSLGLLWLKFTDNPMENNYYRTLVRRKGKDKKFIPTLTSVFDDKLFNGKTFTLSLAKGSANLLEVGEGRFFEVGDTLLVKFCSIDSKHFEFWHSVQSSIIASANPFSVNQTDVVSNINDGLGVWGGYAAAYDTVYAK